MIWYLQDLESCENVIWDYEDFLIMKIIKNLITFKRGFPKIISTTIVIRICNIIKKFKPMTMDFIQDTK